MYCTMFTPERSISPLEMIPSTSINAILLSELLVAETVTSSRFWIRSVIARGCGKTPREKPAKFHKRLITKSPRKTTVRTFQSTLERGRGGGNVKGGGAVGGVGMTGGGVTRG